MTPRQEPKWSFGFRAGAADALRDLWPWPAGTSTSQGSDELGGDRQVGFQLSLAVLVFGSGLRSNFKDVPYLLTRPALLARSLLAVLVVMPVLAVLLVRFLRLSPEVSIALVALSISPLPLLLPQRGEKAGGSTRYGLGLVLVLAVLATPVIFIATMLLDKVFGRDYVATPLALAQLLGFSILARWCSAWRWHECVQKLPSDWRSISPGLSECCFQPLRRRC